MRVKHSDGLKVLNRVAWFTAEETFDWLINGWDTTTGYTYDKATKIIQDSNGFQIQSLDYKGSSTFVTRLQMNGDEKISFPDGLNVTGSIAQQPHNISISSATASIDFSESNIQTLTLAGGVPTHLIPTNMVAGQSVVVEITQDGSSAGTVTIEGSITFPGGTDYVPTTTLGGKDVLTLVSFDGTTARAVGQNDFS
jgi:hypothetical protein